MRRSVLFWYFRISIRALVPGRNLLFLGEAAACREGSEEGPLLLGDAPADLGVPGAGTGGRRTGVLGFLRLLDEWRVMLSSNTGGKSTSDEPNLRALC